MAEKIKEGIRTWLRIQPAQKGVITINETLDFEGNAIKNKIWYRGESEELRQLYSQISGSDNTRFWSAISTTGMEIRKIHVGLPSMIVDILTNIVIADLNEVELDNHQDEWDNIKEVIFKTVYNSNSQEYVLLERYGFGYIEYDLTKNGKSVDLSLVEELANLQPILWNEHFMMAVPLKFFNSAKYKGRGKSIYDGKIDNFDALDEAWSQWMDALRKNRTKEYIPENMLPRNPNNGEILKPNAFDNRFIKLAPSMSENNDGKINTESAPIQHDSYLATYITALDLCLQGIISPSTLGIDVKKLDNAEAQREKEKATLYTRQTIVAELQRVLPALIQSVFYAYQTLNKLPLSDVECDVTFGEYANPSFESQVETVGKAKAQGIMSIEASIDELYGDSRDDEWKKEEVERLKAEQGIVTGMDEPAVSMDLQ